jgi:hypothetical protein
MTIDSWKTKIGVHAGLSAHQKKAFVDILMTVKITAIEDTNFLIKPARL